MLTESPVGRPQARPDRDRHPPDIRRTLRFSWSRTGLKLALLLAFLCTLQDGFLLQVDTLSQSENPARNLTIFLVTWALGIAGVLGTSLLSSSLGRAIWGGLFSVSVMATLTFERIMGHAPSLGDAKILWVETGQTTAAFLFYWSEMLLPAFAAAIFFAAFVLPVRRPRLLEIPWAQAMIAVLPLLPLVMISGMLALKGGGAGVGMPVGTYGPASYIASILYEVRSQPDFVRQEVSYAPPQSSPIDNIILVVDESVSGDFVSLDPRSTITPELARRRHLVADFGQASAGHNCSSYSNAIMRWGITPTSLDGAQESPTVWQYARAAGFTTTYIDAQKQPGTYGNFMSLRETAAIDSLIQYDSPQIERHRDYLANDLRAASSALDAIRSNSRNFIYINKLGAHFPYAGKYPQEAAAYTPDMALFQPLGNSTREQLINSYKNTISWNLDAFFAALLRPEQLARTLVIYTSDHGQNLLDDGTGTHCNRMIESPYQALVPLLVMTGDQALLGAFQDAAHTNRDAASHFNVFPTVLTLMGYPRSTVERDYTQSLLSPIRRLGKFSTGDLLSSKAQQRDFQWREIPAGLERRM